MVLYLCVGCCLPRWLIIGLVWSLGYCIQEGLCHCLVTFWLSCCPLTGVWHEKHKNNISFLFQKCVTEECFFFERLESNNYNTYRSRKYSSWYVALKRTGQYKLGSKTGPGQKAILFLPMSAKSWFTLETVKERKECMQLSLDTWFDNSLCNSKTLNHYLSKEKQVLEKI